MARKDLERAQIVSRNLIPASEFSEFAELLHRVAILGRGIVRELGELVNPDRPEVGIAVLTQWVETRWNPAIDDLITVARGERPDDGIRQAA